MKFSSIFSSIASAIGLGRSSGLDFPDIKPVTLLAGHHEDIAQTGNGCFMNVVSYMQGETPITDRSSVVHPLIQPMFIFMNDVMDDEHRQTLLNLMPRAMMTGTADEAEVKRMAQALYYMFKDLHAAYPHEGLKSVYALVQLECIMEGTLEPGRTAIANGLIGLSVFTKEVSVRKEILNFLYRSLDRDILPKGEFEPAALALKHQGKIATI